jgi:ABC-type multidrug transport system ATPase subunit
LTGTEGAGIKLRGICKAFGGRPVLRGVDLEVGEGQLLAVMGGNGAGKSTLLRILATTLLADAGEASVGGANVSSDPARARRQIGVCLSEERSWYSQISGRRNLEFFAALHGYRRAERRRRTRRVLELVRLAEAADRPFATYSTGMRLRLALARALLHEPQVLLLDEPTRSLDPAGADEFVEQLLHAARSDGRTIFMITHDVREASRSDAVAILRDGLITQTMIGAGQDAILAAATG